MAERIIEYRKEHPIKNLKDLRKAPGIGEKTLGSLRPYLDLPETSSETGSESDEMSAVKLIDPNTATQEELESLPRIGPSMAKRIIQFRKTMKFETLEDLLEVPGIGEKTLEGIAPYLQLSEEDMQEEKPFQVDVNFATEEELLELRYITNGASSTG